MAAPFRNDLTSPLTGRADRLSLTTEFPVEHLVAGYAARLGVDLSPLFRNDDGSLIFDKIQLLRDEETGLSFFHPMIFGDEAFYAKLAEAPHYYPVDKQEFRIVRDLVAAGASVCEVGAGRGHFRAHLPPGNRYLGLEFSGEAIAYGRAAGLDLVKRDVRDLAEAEPESFDVTCSFQVIEHVEEPLAFAEAMVRLTRPGGLIVLSTPNAGGYMARCRELLNAPPHHFTWWEDKTWRWLQARLGLSELTLHHTKIDDVLDSRARMVTADGMAAHFGMTLNPAVDESPLRHRIDELTEPTVKIMLAGLKFRADIPPVGHTTVAVFRK